MCMYSIPSATLVVSMLHAEGDVSPSVAVSVGVGAEEEEEEEEVEEP